MFEILIGAIAIVGALAIVILMVSYFINKEIKEEDESK